MRKFEYKAFGKNVDLIKIIPNLGCMSSNSSRLKQLWTLKLDICASQRGTPKQAVRVRRTSQWPKQPWSAEAVRDHQTNWWPKQSNVEVEGFVEVVRVR